ncbi:formylglycine-generating enzyme family protein [Rhodospirillum sp. A1_3_36]|uniref:formylglycine-generating enzyme family protein n=1 Tax=Rhodospirillum sp. A1_3_36 TaxID=3391666 RepID=UPI0039A5D420
MAERGSSGRADLARLLAVAAEADQDRLGLVLGYARAEQALDGRPLWSGERPDTGSSPPPQTPPPQPPSPQRPIPSKTAPGPVRQAPQAPLPLLMPLWLRMDPEPEPPQEPGEAGGPGMAKAWSNAPTAPPPWPPARSRESLVSQLRRLLAPSWLSGGIDLDEGIRGVAKCLPIRKPPRRVDRSWARRCHVVMDRDEALIPLWADQDRVITTLREVAPAMEVIPVTLDRGDGRFWHFCGDRWETVDPEREDGPWLVLGDLGAASGRDQAVWLSLGRTLAPGQALALTTGGVGDVAPELRALWRIETWEDMDRNSPCDAEERRRMLHKLLIYLSPTLCFSPGLLRAMRRALLPRADMTVECLVWADPAVEVWSPILTCLRPDRAEGLRRAFEGDLLTDGERTEALKVIRSWRSGGRICRGAEEFWFPEILNLSPEIRHCLPDPGDLAEARRYFGALHRRQRGGDTLTLEQRVWVAQLEQRVPAAADREEEVRAVVDAVRAVQRTRKKPSSGGALEAVALRHDGDRLTLDPVIPGTGSLVAILPTNNGIVDMEGPDPLSEEVRRRFPWSGPGQDPLAVKRRRYEVRPGQSVPIDWSAPPFQMPYSMAERMVGGALRGIDGWASSAGRDAHGVWAEFTYRGITQRLRWCPPGRFRMGSPQDEVNRFDNEGPLTEITIADGFWLFDTAVTQALYEAVMGTNPSWFTEDGTSRPVERVSFEDAEMFLSRLNGEMSGLVLSLPSEAQWEYACRAGSDAPFEPTVAATHRGQDITVEEVNYDGNDPLGEEGKGAYRKETVPVKGVPFRPNAWGLWHMQGNVDEWCADLWSNSHDGADPLGKPRLESEKGERDRVVRGGSWYDYPRDCRAAIRYGLAPDDRFNYLGFRPAGGQVPSSSKPGDGPEGRLGFYGPEGRGRGSGTAGKPEASAVRDPGGRAERGSVPERLRVTPGRGARIGLPAAPFILCTDRAELVVQQRTLETLPWASAVGRDRYGLWSEFTYEGVLQRLRWCPPGRFLMGSPEDESGRYDREGPQTEITIAEGFWLFDTPVTQALYEAVTGEKNPSRFQSPDRPVERVSWEDAGRFLDRLNGLLPGLDLGLPSEAQWEYACRAGTREATYAGPMDILGEHNAPILEEIAWYGGNSGVEFDLENGLDSSHWEEKAHDHKTAGTHPVKGKDPNPWGLHDMLGNVWEWCADLWSDSHDGADPFGKPRLESEKGERVRVVRGGSWRSRARYCRAAIRNGYAPDVRLNSIGFRPAGGQVPSSSKSGDGPEGSLSLNGPEGRGRDAGTAD